MVSLPVGEAWKEGNEDDLNIIQNCYCPNCQASAATTTMLPTRIPNFREVIVMSLFCEECNFRNSEISFGGEIQVKGERITFTLTSPDDLNRQMVKSDSAILSIPSLELEFPKRGGISTIEGFLRQAANNLEELQPERLKLGDLDNFYRCSRVISQLRRLAGEDEQKDDHDDDNRGGEGESNDKKSGQEEETKALFPFDIVLDDPAGNSFLENPHAPKPDPHIKTEKYFRTPTQDMSLGLQPSQQAIEEGFIDDNKPDHKNMVNAAPGSHTFEKVAPEKTDNFAKQEVLKFPTTCAHCYQPAETSVFLTDIPHFKEVIIMSLLCDNCGFKSNEIKGGGAIPKFGTKITLRVDKQEDLEREVLKSDTAGIAIPELDLELEEGGLDGLYTTVEGLLNKMHERLLQANPFGSGDAARKQHIGNDGGGFSSPSPNNSRYLAFLQKLKACANGQTFPFSVIISDPLSNSFIGPIPADAVALSLQAEREGSNKCYDNYEDPQMEIQEYERTHEQNEVLGLNDMKTENYSQGFKDLQQYYGTDTMEELPDRIRRADIRGPDHPHEVGKAPVDQDTTVMGSKSANFAVPSMLKRGKAVSADPAPVNDQIVLSTLKEILHEAEHSDGAFVMNDQYEGPRNGMVFKDGAQGLGYYTNVTLIELWEKHKMRHLQ